MRASLKGAAAKAVVLAILILSAIVRPAGAADELAAAASGLTNFRLSFTPAGEKLEVGASVENLADKHYAVQAFDLTGVDGVVQSYPGAPRWFKVHVNYHF